MRNYFAILIQIYPRKRGWPDLPHSNGNLSNSHSPSPSIQGILLLQTNALALPLHLHLPRLLWSSSLALALHFKLQCLSQNMPIIPPQHMAVPSHSIRLCHLNHHLLQSQHLFVLKIYFFFKMSVKCSTCLKLVPHRPLECGAYSRRERHLFR